MKPQQGQLNDLHNLLKINVSSQNVEIIVEAGLDKGKTFYGTFMAKVNNKHYTITDGELIKTI